MEDASTIWLCHTLRNHIANYQAPYCTRLAAIKVLNTVARAATLRQFKEASGWASSFAFVVMCMRYALGVPTGVESSCTLLIVAILECYLTLVTFQSRLHLG